MRKRRRRGKAFKRLILFLIMVPAAIWLLVRVSVQSDTTVDHSPTDSSVSSRTESEAAPVPTAEVVWTYPEGYVLENGGRLEKPLLVVCPGSLGEPRDRTPTFATLTVRENGILAGLGKL